MGDAFDDDEDRLMIDDVVEQGSVNATSTTRKNNSSCAQGELCFLSGGLIIGTLVLLVA